MNNMVTSLNSTHYVKLYPQNGERIVIIDYVTSFHSMHRDLILPCYTVDL